MQSLASHQTWWVSLFLARVRIKHTHFLVLILIDRTMDITSMLTHTWTYSSLVHDVLNMELNRVVVTVIF
jgi:hypothetical protein